MERPAAMTDPLSALHLRYDGLIPDSERKRAEGIDPVDTAKSAVKWWSGFYYETKRELQTRVNLTLSRKMQLRQNLDYYRDGLAKAEKRLAELEGRPTEPEPGPGAFFKCFTRGI